jgi:hypothetical protein
MTGFSAISLIAYVPIVEVEVRVVKERPDVFHLTGRKVIKTSDGMPLSQ